MTLTVNRVRKVLKKYLNWTQNSVFEGQITEGKLHKCLAETNKFLNSLEDSLYIYIVKNPHNIKKEIIGQDKSYNELFL